jgi:putative transposase
VTGKRHTLEEIVEKLRMAEVHQTAGLTIGETCRKLAVSKPTLSRWRKRYADVMTRETKRVATLEAENARLKRIAIDLLLDNDVLKETLRAMERNHPGPSMPHERRDMGKTLTTDDTSGGGTQTDEPG